VNDRLRTDLVLLLTLVADSDGLGLFEWRVREGTLHGDQRWLDIGGLSGDAASPTTGAWRAAIHPDDVARVWKAIEEHLAQGTTAVDVEYRLQRPAGGWVRVRDRLRVVERDPGGEALRAVGARIDLTTARDTETALRESEERYRRITETISDYIYTVRVVNGRAGETRHGAGCVAVTGFTTEEFASQPLLWHSMIVEADRAAVEEQARRILAGEERPPLEHRIARKDGRVRWVRNTPVLHRDESGALLSYDGLIQDVTERRQAAEALSASEQRYRLLFESNPLPMWVYDLESLRFVAVNDAAVAHYGYSRDEFLGMTIGDIRPQEDVPRLLPNVAQVTAGVDEGGGWRHRRKDGTLIDVEITSHTLTFAGRRAELVLANDVTEARRAEEALRASETRLKSIFRAAPVGIGLVSERSILDVNDRVCEMVGYTREQLIGQSERILYPNDEEFEYVGREKYHQIAERGTGTVETCWARSDGEMIDVLLSSTPLDPDNQAAGVTFTALDITARRRAEEEREKLQAQLLQAQKMEAVGRLAGGVAHDFNNLLTIILGHAELGRFEVADAEPLASRLANIHEAGQRARDLTQQILAFSRRQVLRMATLDLNSELRSVEKMLRRLIGEDVDVVVRLGAEPLWVRADGSQLDQIVMNLAVNSRDAMPGGGTLTISTGALQLAEADVAAHPEIRVGPYVVLTVSDTGTGMDPETLSHVFEPFFTTKELGRGTGLGLATVYGIVKQHGGHIQVRSEVGRGTTFRIYLPRRDETDEDSDGPAIHEAAASGSETILVVEDDDAVRRLTSSVLATNGYRVLEARSADQALEVARRNAGALDLLLTDVILPGLNGRELFGRLAADSPRLRALFMSGYSGDIVARHGVLEPGVEFIGKPFAMATLARRVREVLDAGRTAPPGA
jgi:two-component system cell cycle sensor histidine kinase/response regulator CckA